MATFAFVLAMSGFGAHGLSILHRGVFSGFFPFATLFDGLSFFAWTLMAVFALVRHRIESPVFGAFAVPLASVMLIYGSTFAYQIHAPLLPVMVSLWLPVHVVLAIAGHAVFALMAVGGVMYLWQERLIKRKQIGRWHRLLPSLETLDTMNRHGLAFGFFLLTLGIMSGALWAGSAWGSYWTWDPKETWSLITWFAYAAMVHQRLVLGWRGKRAAWLAILGFVLVMFTFIGVSVLMGGHHSFEQAGLPSRSVP